MRLPERDIDSIEDAIATLSNQEWRELAVPMAPNGVTSFCAEAALLQFVVTWARNYQSEAVATFSDLYNSAENFEASLQKHLGLPYVLAAWVLAGQLQGGDGSVLKRREAKGYLRFNFDSRRVIITPDYNALNWREQPYGAAAQEEEKDQEYAAQAPLRRSVAW